MIAPLVLWSTQLTKGLLGGSAALLGAQKLERRVRRAIADDRLNSAQVKRIQDAARESIEVNLKEIERIELWDAKERELMDREIRPALERLRVLFEPGDRRQAIRELSSLDGWASGSTPWGSFEEFNQLATGCGSTDRLVAINREREAVEAKNEVRAKSYLGKSDGAAVRSGFDPAVMPFELLYRGHKDAEPHLGTHVRTPRPVITHHGIVVGRNRVVHFDGEPKKKADAAIRETDWKQFAKNSKDFHEVIPTDLDNDPISTLRRAITVFLALKEAQSSQRRYDLVLDNCEHFAISVQLGVGFSRQIRHPQRNIKLFRWKSERFYDGVLAYQLTKTTELELFDRLDTSPLLDLGRAYIDRETQESQIYLPLLSEETSAGMMRDDCWSDARGRTWHEDPPSGSINVDYSEPFAALVWKEGVGARWITQDGDSLIPRFDLGEVVDDRLALRRKWLARYLHPGVIFRTVEKVASVVTPRGPTDSRPS